MLRTFLLSRVKLGSVQYSHRLCYSSWTKFDQEDEDNFNRTVRTQHPRTSDFKRFNKRNKQDGFGKHVIRNEAFPATKPESPNTISTSPAASSNSSATDDKDDNRKSFLRPVQDVIDARNKRTFSPRNRFSSGDYGFEDNTQPAARPTRDEIRAKYAAVMAKLPPSSQKKNTRMRFEKFENMDSVARPRFRSNVRHSIARNDGLFSFWNTWEMYDKRFIKNRSVFDETKFDERSSKKTSYFQDRKLFLLSSLNDNFCKETERRALSANEWQRLYEETKVKFDNIKFLPGVLMACFLRKAGDPGTQALATSLYNYERQLDETAWSNNTALQLLYMRFLSDSGCDESEFLPIYDRVMQKTDGLLDSQSATTAFIVIAKTSRFKTEAQRLVDIIREFNSLSSEVKSAWIEALGRSGDKIETENLFITLSQDYKPFTDEALLSLLQHCGREWLLDVLRKTRYIVSEKVARTIANNAQTTNIKAEWIRITKGKPCSSCSAEFENIRRLKTDEFETLRSAFMERVIIRKDIFINASPDELAAFQSFLREQKPFDFVVDALNVSYIANWRMSTQQQASLLTWVVEYLARQGQRVLVLGRRHMEKWPRDIMARMAASCQVFFCEDVSKDDPFTLYAAMHSGPNAMIVTRDELRDHKFRLGKELADSFVQWQRTQQLVFRGIFVDRENQLYLSFRWPNGHETSVQRTPHGWHIPYEDNEPRFSFEPPNSWLCLHERNANPLIGQLSSQ